MIYTVSLWVALPLLSLAVILTFVRLVRGPSLPDRVVAFNLLTTIALAIITVYAIVKDQQVFLDVAILVALITFLGTIAFARYLEKKG